MTTCQGRLRSLSNFLPVNRQLRSSGIWSGRPPPLPLGMVKPRALAIAGTFPFSWRRSFCWASYDLQTRCTVHLIMTVFVCLFVCLFVCWFVRSFVRLFVCLLVGSLVGSVGRSVGRSVGWLVVGMVCFALLCFVGLSLKYSRPTRGAGDGSR